MLAPNSLQEGLGAELSLFNQSPGDLPVTPPLQGTVIQMAGFLPWAWET